MSENDTDLVTDEEPVDRAGPEPGTQQITVSKSYQAPAARPDVSTIWSDGTSLFVTMPNGNRYTMVLGQADAFSAANIAAIGHAVNTSGKFAGRIVFDTTNNRYMRATGATAASPWRTLEGVTAVTPA